MPTSRLPICLLVLFCFSTILFAQDQKSIAGPKASPVITATTAGERVRFVSSASVCQIRVQILSA
ncbi:MAG: hypothetical protein ABI837_13000, partial [Acidobacteriota bacterium]